MFALKLLMAIIGLSILVIVHEGGHYLAARAFGMRVLRFSIGFGPTIFRYQPKGNETVFQVAAIPFLAYVQIAGMNPHEDLDRSDPALFPNKSVFARIVTIAAGPFANYLAASLICFVLAMTGMPDREYVTPMTAGEVMEGSAAADAGLEVGDVFITANDLPVADVEELIAITAPRAGTPTVYVVERDGERLTFTISPRAEAGGPGRIGVAPLARHIYPQYGVADAAKLALVVPVRLTIAQVQGISQMISQRTTEGVMGPVGITKMVMQESERGLPHLVAMLMMISMALGFANLLPFPALDGGRLVFLGYEVVTRRPPNEKFEAAVHTIGILFLLFVLVLVTYRDILAP